MRRVASRFEISSGQKADLSELSKPDRTATAGWIFDDVRHDIKSIFVEERAAAFGAACLLKMGNMPRWSPGHR